MALLTGRENTLLLGVLAGDDAARRRGRRWRRSRRRSGLGEHYERLVASYSQGMRARLGLAVIERTEPAILLLDEIHEALDHEFRDHVEATRASCSRAGGVVVATGHDHPMLERLCDARAAASGAATSSPTATSPTSSASTSATGTRDLTRRPRHGARRGSRARRMGAEGSADAPYELRPPDRPDFCTVAISPGPSVGPIIMHARSGLPGPVARPARGGHRRRDRRRRTPAGAVDQDPRGARRAERHRRGALSLQGRAGARTHLVQARRPSRSGAAAAA